MHQASWHEQGCKAHLGRHALVQRPQVAAHHAACGQGGVPELPLALVRERMLGSPAVQGRLGGRHGGGHVRRRAQGRSAAPAPP